MQLERACKSKCGRESGREQNKLETGAAKGKYKNMSGISSFTTSDKF